MFHLLKHSRIGALANPEQASSWRHHAGQLLGIRQGQPLGSQFTHSDRQTGDQSRHETETQGRVVWGQLRKKGASIRLVCCLEKQSSSESKFPYSAISHYAIKDQVIQDGL